MGNIDNIKHKQYKFEQKLNFVKNNWKLNNNATYYGYNILSNIDHIGDILNNNLNIIIDSRKILDIGCADGDLTFFLEYMYPNKSYTCIDYDKTNWNSMKGLYTLKSALDSKTKIINTNIEEFKLTEKYDLVLALGLFYHIKNPVRFLEILQKHSEYVLFSTRIASFTPDSRYNVNKYSYGYFPTHNEINNDPTNWWIFTEGCLKKMFERIGFNIVQDLKTGNTNISTPNDRQKDCRYFCLLKNKFKI